MCANLGVLTLEQSFDFCRTVVAAAGDPELREVFRRALCDWLEFNFQKSQKQERGRLIPKLCPGSHRKTKRGRVAHMDWAILEAKPRTSERRDASLLFGSQKSRAICVMNPS